MLGRKGKVEEQLWQGEMNIQRYQEADMADRMVRLPFCDT